MSGMDGDFPTLENVVDLLIFLCGKGFLRSSPDNIVKCTSHNVITVFIVQQKKVHLRLFTLSHRKETTDVGQDRTRSYLFRGCFK